MWKIQGDSIKMTYCFRVASLDRIVRNGFSELNPS